VLERFPFLILVLGGFLAGGSAVLLRRAASVFGEWLGLISVAASLSSAVAFVSAFYWSATMAGAPASAAVGRSLIGWALGLVGGALAGWGLRVRGLGVLRRWPVERFEQRRPFRLLRRPIELGVTAAAVGLAVLWNASTVWVCLGTWHLAWNLMLEMGDWELRQRLPACRDYMKRTPRYLVRVRKLTLRGDPPPSFARHPGGTP
jgi:hypothetical protein